MPVKDGTCQGLLALLQEEVSPEPATPGADAGAVGTDVSLKALVREVSAVLRPLCDECEVSVNPDGTAVDISITVYEHLYEDLPPMFAVLAAHGATGTLYWEDQGEYWITVLEGGVAVEYGGVIAYPGYVGDVATREIGDVRIARLTREEGGCDAVWDALFVRTRDRLVFACLAANPDVPERIRVAAVMRAEKQGHAGA